MRRTKHTIRLLICLLIIASGSLAAEVRLQVRDGHPFADDVYVNGHGPYRFLIDTGSNVNLIEPSLARSIGLTADYKTELASSMGVAVVPGSNDNEVSLDSTKAQHQQFLHLRLAFHDRWPDVQGLLGQGFLQQLDYTLDLKGKRLVFGKPVSEGTRTPLRMINGRMVVHTSVGELVLDSGADRLVLFGVRSDLGLDSRFEMRTLAGTGKIGMISGTVLAIAERKIWRGDALAIPKRREAGIDGLMPLGLFRTVSVCNSEGYVIFD